MNCSLYWCRIIWLIKMWLIFKTVNKYSKFSLVYRRTRGECHHVTNNNLRTFSPLDCTLLITIAESVDRIYIQFLFYSSRCQIKLCMFRNVFYFWDTLFFTIFFLSSKLRFCLVYTYCVKCLLFYLFYLILMTEINIYRLDFEALMLCLWRKIT